MNQPWSVNVEAADARQVGHRRRRRRAARRGRPARTITSAFEYCATNASPTPFLAAAVIGEGRRQEADTHDHRDRRGQRTGARAGAATPGSTRARSAAQLAQRVEDRVRASGRRATRPADRQRASRRGRRTRLPFGSWVTITTVWPSSRTERRRNPSTSADDALSRLPVGSSAKTTVGRVTSARAIATRCCWPPDSSDGRCRSRSRGRARRRWCRTRPSRASARPGRTAAGCSAARSACPSRLKDWKTKPTWSRRILVSWLSYQPRRVRGRRATPGPTVDGVEAGEAVHQRRLARPRRPHDRGEPARPRSRPRRRRARAPRSPRLP